MGFEIVSSDGDSHGSLANRDVPDVRVIVKVARGELRRLIQERAEITKRTQACRKVLMDAGCPLTARNVCEQIQQRTDLPCSKNLVGAVTTVLSRLEQYGEARTVPRDSGPRGWVWVSGVEIGSFHPVDSAVDSQV
ncbi:MAG: hypothetical protein WCA20_25475 [Candidatus Sulfotelmatobacter sp.]